MIDYNLFERIYFSGDTTLFRGGISSFQIKVRAFFNEDEITNTLFVFVSKTTKQVKLYCETNKGTWLTTYRIREGILNIPKHNESTYKLSKEEMKWIIEGINLKKIRQNHIKN